MYYLNSYPFQRPYQYEKLKIYPNPYPYPNSYAYTYSHSSPDGFLNENVNQNVNQNVNFKRGFDEEYPYNTYSNNYYASRCPFYVNENFNTGFW